MITNFNNEFIEAPSSQTKIHFGIPYCLDLTTNPSCLSQNTIIKKISCGFNFTTILSICGRVYTWGTNDFGQLGLNLPDDIVINSPKLVKFNNINTAPYVTDIACGTKHTISTVYYDGRVKIFTWGYGQGSEPIVKPNDNSMVMALCDPKMMKITNSFLPVLVKFDEPVVSIHAGCNMSAVISRKSRVNSSENFNTIYTFGETANHTLGYQHTFTDELGYWSIPTEVGIFAKNDKSVVDVSFSENHTLFLVNEYENCEGSDDINLEIKNKESSKQLSSTVYACGFNKYNQCGFNEKKTIIEPEPLVIPKNALDVLYHENSKNDNHNDSDSDRDLAICSKIKNIKKISAGNKSSMLLTDDNKIITIGCFTSISGNDIISSTSSNNKQSKKSRLEISQIGQKQSSEKVIKICNMDDSAIILTSN